MTTPNTQAQPIPPELTIKVDHLGPAHAPLSNSRREQYIRFLADHLEHWGDPPEHIALALDYAQRRGGLVVTAWQAEDLAGAALTNETGMGGYVPENLLVYAAVDPARRGQGIGGSLIRAIQGEVTGDIALHVEANNPAKHLYERCGFTAPYHEMRWRR